MEVAHPEAVEVKNMQRQVPFGHAIDEFDDGFFVVVGGEGGGKPEAEGPGWREAGAAGEGGVLLKDLFGSWAVNDEVVDPLSGDAELNSGDLLGGDFEGDRAGVVYKDSVPFVGEVEGDIFVGLIAAGAAVFVPNFDGLAVFDE